MRVVRRLYFYTVAFISLQVILWGVITLASSSIDAPVAGGLANLLARGLSQVLVGLPFFLIHWRVIQRDLAEDVQEHQTFIRAIFNYGLQLATLIPVLTNLHAIIRRPLLLWTHAIPPSQNFLASTSLTQNLISIALNLVVFIFASRLSRFDWHAFPDSHQLKGVRRVYRYTWQVISIISLVVGVQELIFSILFIPSGIGSPNNLKLVSGFSVTLIATVLWVETTRRIESSVADFAEERTSILRTVFLFVTTLSGIAVVLSLSGIVLYDFLRWVFGENLTATTFISDHSSFMAIIIPFAVVWAFYFRSLKLHITSNPDPLQQAGLRRLFDSILALAGNILVFIGLWLLLNVLSENLLQSVQVIKTQRGNLASGLTLLVIGLPLWISTWRRLQDDVHQNDARQSVIRKTFLYLLIFASVVGLMAAVGWLAYRLINAALGNITADFALFILKQILLIVLLTIWLVYHLKVLRSDGNVLHKSLIERHAAYPLTLLSEDGNDLLTANLQALLQKSLPDIPLKVHNLNSPTETIDLSKTAALIVPATLLLRKPGQMAEILNSFQWKVIIIPQSEPRLTWVGITSTTTESLVQETLRIVRQSAEGQEVKPASLLNGWVIAGYILGVIFALQVLALLFVLVVNVVLD